VDADQRGGYGVEDGGKMELFVRSYEFFVGCVVCRVCGGEMEFFIVQSYEFFVGCVV
jgi:hypothetical protein